VKITFSRSQLWPYVQGQAEELLLSYLSFYAIVDLLIDFRNWPDVNDLRTKGPAPETVVHLLRLGIKSTKNKHVISK